MSELDLHAIRHRLKLLGKTAESEHYENRDSVPCPACSEPFDQLLATSERTRSFDPPDGVGVCFLREDERLLVFTHE